MKKRNNKQIFFIDLAMPRNIDPEVGKLQDVHLYNIDSLKNIANKNLAKREKEINSCKKIINDSIKRFT